MLVSESRQSHARRLGVQQHQWAGEDQAVDAAVRWRQQLQAVNTKGVRRLKLAELNRAETCTEGRGDGGRGSSSSSSSDRGRAMGRGWSSSKWQAFFFFFFTPTQKKQTEKQTKAWTFDEALVSWLHHLKKNQHLKETSPKITSASLQPLFFFNSQLRFLSCRCKVIVC